MQLFDRTLAGVYCPCFTYSDSVTPLTLVIGYKYPAMHSTDNSVSFNLEARHRYSRWQHTHTTQLKIKIQNSESQLMNRLMYTSRYGLENHFKYVAKVQAINKKNR